MLRPENFHLLSSVSYNDKRTSLRKYVHLHSPVKLIAINFSSTTIKDNFTEKGYYKNNSSSKLAIHSLWSAHM
ncbi:unnamed protein product [Rhizophagus irregularis]|nr:unnamed protein product [Rhizophagus irregularis]